MWTIQMAKGKGKGKPSSGGKRSNKAAIAEKTTTPNSFKSTYEKMHRKNLGSSFTVEICNAYLEHSKRL